MGSCKFGSRVALVLCNCGFCVNVGCVNLCQVSSLSLK